MHRSASSATCQEESIRFINPHPNLTVFDNLSRPRRTASLKMTQFVWETKNEPPTKNRSKVLLNRVKSLMIRNDNAIGKRKLRRSFSARRRSDFSSNSNSLDFGSNDRLSKKERYFSEKQDKNIFMKLIHPSYHKRNQWFRKLFVEKHLIDNDEVYLASYSCAYQREILAQGRMFISQSHVSFYANIFGWETNLVIPLNEVEAITKQKAAYIFPNSIQIEKKNGDKFFFASFVNRDKSYQILKSVMDRNRVKRPMGPEEVWELLNNPDEKSPSIPPSSSPSMTVHHTRSMNGGSNELTKGNSVKMEKDNCSQTSSLTSDYVEEEILDESGLSTIEVAEECSTSSHTTEATDPTCPCAEHTGRLVLDTVFSCTVQQFYTLNFTENAWFQNLLTELKTSDYATTVWVREKSGCEARNCTYSIALNHAMAPKNVIVNERQQLTHFPKPEDGFMVLKETQNSGVPYADNFVVHCTYCVSRVGQNQCRVKVHGSINYKKSIWSIVKGYIEKGTHQGLDSHYQVLERSLNEECERLSRTTSEKDTSSQLRHRKSKDSAKHAPQTSPIVASTSLTQSSIPLNLAHVQNTVIDYSWHFSALIIILTLFLISNFWILLTIRSNSSTHSEPQLRHLIQSLTSEIERLQEQVGKLNLRSDL